MPSVDHGEAEFGVLRGDRGDQAATRIPPVNAGSIRDVNVKGFRSAREVSFSPGPICALVGEARSGKSNLLAAIRAALDPGAAPLSAADAAADGDGSISIRARLADGNEVVLAGTPDDYTVDGPPGTPPVVFLPAAERVSAQLVDAIAARSAAGERGLLVLIEEPELYLRPQAQRYLYRLLRQLASAGNQVVYSTQSPAFLNVARLDELVFVERLPSTGTRALQPEPVTADDDFRVMTEFDAARSELFLARSVVLVEGLTEKLVLPFVFSALGYDVDLEAISIVECGGKPNIPLFARVCRATGIPFVAVHDSDRRTSGRLAPAERALNALITELAGKDRVVVLDPDFEAVAGLEGNSHKPERAWREFAARAAAEMPRQLVHTAELAVALARR